MEKINQKNSPKEEIKIRQSKKYTKKKCTSGKNTPKKKQVIAIHYKKSF